MPDTDAEARHSAARQVSSSGEACAPTMFRLDGASRTVLRSIIMAMPEAYASAGQPPEGKNLAWDTIKTRVAASKFLPPLVRDYVDWDIWLDWIRSGDGEGDFLVFGFAELGFAVWGALSFWIRPCVFR
ncbi:hypothetical protein [Bifidobacterium moukalabense]|uniref:hypothetical protein n=1 Tax=Bifidobacterium moukalabense TaxID=1333651 RepID=UPI0010F9BD91|nr:hypothetical protein [Bifidobacterium moukalabense]